MTAIPPPVAVASVTFTPSTTPLTQQELDTQRILLEPFVYLTQQRGKEIRSKLVHAFNQWLKVPAEKLRLISEIIEMLHTASLLYFLALKKAIALEIPCIMDIFAEELIHLHTGQGMEIYWRDSHICPTEQEYVDMVKNKTGGLLRLAVRMMQAASQEKRDFVPLVDMLGIHFQIRDDYLNLVSEEFTSNKGFAEDLTEGKFSYPIILHIQRTHHTSPTSTTPPPPPTEQQRQLTISSVTDPTSRQLFHILKQRTHDPDLKRYAIETMKKGGSLEVVRKQLARLERDAREEVARGGGNIELERILDFLGVAYAAAPAAGGGVGKE
ncbi:Geranylgeranyl pyrophosphate synthase [Podochytrium sp. JEL0797]|nr:Geranylgeranyl pyrophosphate synthase [Podochytrium sp. JEL0797]